jgi:hypothetical protein
MDPYDFLEGTFTILSVVLPFVVTIVIFRLYRTLMKACSSSRSARDS